MTKKIQLTENTQVEQARAILATQTVIADMQTMINKLAKMSSNTIMSISDAITNSYGLEFSSTFVKEVNSEINDVIQRLQQARETISAKVQNMSDILAGDTDIDNDAGVENINDNDVDTNTTSNIAGDKPEDDIQTTDNTTDDDITTQDIDDIFATDPTEIKKKQPTTESIATNIIKRALRESK